MNEIAKALHLWVKLTGVSPKQTSFRGFRQLSVSVTNDELRKTFQYDKTGITTMLFLDALTEAYLSEVHFNINDILFGNVNMDEYLQRARELFNVLRTDYVKSLRDSFREKVRLAVADICKGKIPKSVTKMLNSNNDLAYLRRDAVRAHTELRVFQFLQGKPDTEPPVYHPVVFEFWNINSFVNSLCTMPSGIVIALIRDPIETQCYFVFGIRNGGTVTILTDKPEHPHPMFRHMTRKPERRFEERAYRHHFPYELMDYKFDKKGEVYFPSVSDGTSLVPYQKTARLMKPIKELNPDEVIWIALMFDLILKKYFTDNFQAKELAYTGEMVRLKPVLLKSAQSHALQVENYKSLEADTLTTKHITQKSMMDQWERKPTGDNKWLERKFAKDSLPESLNLLGPPAKDEVFIDPKTNQVVRVPVVEGFTEENNRSSDIRERGLISLQELDATMFGTALEIINDQKWVARYNQAKQVNRKVAEYYAKTKNEVIAWYREHTFLNMWFLIDCIKEGDCTVRGYTWFREGFGIKKIKGQHILDIIHVPLSAPARDKSQSGYHHWARYEEGILAFHNGFTRNHAGRYLCYFNEKPSSYLCRFNPTSPHGVAKICGCKVSELPEQLQHYQYRENYSGNSILNRLDPMDWVVKNPWVGKDMSVRIYLSQSTYNDLMKGKNLFKGEEK